MMNGSNEPKTITMRMFFQTKTDGWQWFVAWSKNLPRCSSCGNNGALTTNNVSFMFWYWFVFFSQFLGFVSNKAVKLFSLLRYKTKSEWLSRWKSLGLTLRELLIGLRVQQSHPVHAVSVFFSCAVDNNNSENYVQEVFLFLISAVCFLVSKKFSLLTFTRPDKREKSWKTFTLVSGASSGRHDRTNASGRRWRLSVGKVIARASWLCNNIPRQDEKLFSLNIFVLSPTGNEANETNWLKVRPNLLSKLTKSAGMSSMDTIDR